MAAEVRAFAALGVTHLALSFGSTDHAEVSGDIDRFVAEVAPLAG